MKRAYAGATVAACEHRVLSSADVVAKNCTNTTITTTSSTATTTTSSNNDGSISSNLAGGGVVVVSSGGGGDGDVVVDNDPAEIDLPDSGPDSGSGQPLKLAKLADTRPGAEGEIAGLEQLELAVTPADAGTGDDVSNAEGVLLVEAIQSGGTLIAVAGSVIDGSSVETVARSVADVTEAEVVTDPAAGQMTVDDHSEKNLDEDQSNVEAGGAACEVMPEVVQETAEGDQDVATTTEWVTQEADTEAEATAVAAAAGDEDEAATGTSIMDNEWLEEGDGSWPPIWTRKMWLERRAKHHWLSGREGRLGCRYCLRVKYMGTSAGDAIDVSSEWVSYSIAYSGDTREQQLKSLRNKIQRHEVSKAHARAEELINSNKNILPTHSQVTQTLNRQVHMASQVFKDVYAIVKAGVDFESNEKIFEDQLKQRPYRDFAISQKFEATSIVEHIAEQMRSQLVRHVMGHQFPLAVIVDHVEGYLGSVQSVFLIYLRIRSESSGLRNVFWDAIPYPSPSDPTMGPMPVVSQSLLDGGFTVDFLSQNLLCFVTDPLGAHLGAESNLCHQLALSFDKIVIWYVLAYRLEEMVLATMRKLAAPNYVGQLYETLFALTQLSERNVQELLINTPAIYDQVVRVGRLFRPADVASTFKAVSAVSESYAILYMYMVQAGEDTTRTEAEKRKYSFVKGLMESEQFVRELALMYDVLKLLHDTRVQVDSADCDMARADSVLVQAMEGLMALRQQPGPFEAATLAELQPGGSRTFISVGPLIDNPLLQAPNRDAFMDHIVELSRQNMISISGLGEHLVENFISDLHTINLANWPLNPPVTFADEAVSRLCSVFELTAREADIREAFRNFVRNGRQSSAISPEMALLQSHANVFPCSSELYSSVVDKINKCKAGRSLDSVRNLSASLFVHVNGDSKFVPLQLVRTWCVKHPLAAESKMQKKKRTPEEEQQQQWTVAPVRIADELVQGQSQLLQTEEGFVAVLQG